MSLIANAKAKAANGSVKEAFTNEDGAIDLASIMVGIIVIGLIGGVIAATVFAVIPWAQDNAAKQQLDSVAAAQSAFIGLTSDNGAVYYGDEDALNTAGLFDGTNVDGLVITPVGTGSAAHYGAALPSSSGAIFYIGDQKTQPTLVTAATDIADVPATVTEAAAAGAAGDFTGNVTP